jgi:hypothetical protein
MNMFDRVFHVSCSRQLRLAGTNDVDRGVSFAFFCFQPMHKEAWIGLFFEHQPVFEGDCAVISQPAPF